MDRAHPFAQAAAGAIAPRSAAVVVAAVVGYVALLFALRLALSPFLEIDEAQFVGAVDLRLVYDNSHPLLYNWLVRALLEATGWNWALSVALLRAVLLAATYLLVFDAARRLAGVEGGVIALAATALMPQVSWMAAHTHAHSILVMAAAAGVVHALVLIAIRNSAAAFLALGVAAGVGVMAKFNALLLLAPLVVAVALDPFMRRRFATARAVIAPVAFTLVAAPALAGVLLSPTGSTGRMAKLYREGPFSALDVPALGVDGVLSLGLSTLASAGVVLGLVVLFGRRAADPSPAVSTVRRLLWRAIAFGLAGSAVAVLALDITEVRERYLTPLLMPLPVLAALHLAAWRRRGLVVAAGALAFGAVPFGILGMTLLDDHRFARPYPAIAAAIIDAAPAGAIAVESSRQSLAANVALALRMAGREAWIAGDPLSGTAPVLARVRPGDGPLGTEGWPLPDGVCPVGERLIAPPLLNLTGRNMTARIGVFAAPPCPAAR